MSRRCRCRCRCRCRLPRKRWSGRQQRWAASRLPVAELPEMDKSRQPDSAYPGARPAAARELMVAVRWSLTDEVVVRCGERQMTLGWARGLSRRARAARRTAAARLAQGGAPRRRIRRAVVLLRRCRGVTAAGAERHSCAAGTDALARAPPRPARVPRFQSRNIRGAGGGRIPRAKLVSSGGLSGIPATRPRRVFKLGLQAGHRPSRPCRTSLSRTTSLRGVDEVIRRTRRRLPQHGHRWRLDALADRDRLAGMRQLERLDAALLLWSAARPCGSAPLIFTNPTQVPEQLAGIIADTGPRARGGNRIVQRILQCDRSPLLADRFLADLEYQSPGLQLHRPQALTNRAGSVASASESRRAHEQRADHVRRRAWHGIDDPAVDGAHQVVAFRPA